MLIALRHGAKIDGKITMRSDSGRPSLFELRVITVPKARDEDWDGWDLIACPLSEAAANFLIMEPGRYVLELSNGATSARVGVLVFHYSPAPQLTDEQKLALRANPLAYNFVALSVGDSATGKELCGCFSYVALGRTDTSIQTNGRAPRRVSPGRAPADKSRPRCR